MDYNAWNIALDKEKQGEYVMSTLGPYDYWAIEYAYKPLRRARARRRSSRRSPRAAASRCSPIATDEETAARRRHGPAGEPARPGQRPARLRAPPHAAVARAVGPLAGRRSSAPDESRDVLYRNVVAGFTQYALAAQVASKYVGGVVYVRDYAGSDARAVHAGRAGAPARGAEARDRRPVPARQLPASSRSSSRASPPTRSRPAPGERANFTLASRVLAVQTQALDRLMSDAVAARLLDSSFKTGETRKKALSLSDLYDTLQGAIWSDLKGGGDITPHAPQPAARAREADDRDAHARERRRARRCARAAARERARADRELRAAQSRPGLSKEARAHVADSLNTLEEALKAPMQRVAA